jgi:hypothetical protein
VVLVSCWLGTTPSSVSALGTCGKGGALGTRVMTPFQGSLYYITTPASYDEARAWPLIFGLHGDEGDPAMSVNWNWRSVVDDRFIFVAPKASNASGSWYEEREQNSMWMDALLTHLLAQYNVDLDRVYIWGLSGGAEFISSYALERQDRFAAVQFNMGGNRWGWVSAGSPSPATCKIPARFVVSMTDFLRDGALSLFDELTMLGHETVWLDADCDGHCWDDVESGVGGREFLLAHTLCGMERPAGCEGGPVATTDPDAGAMMPQPSDAGVPAPDVDAGMPMPVAGMSAPVPGAPATTPAAPVAPAPAATPALIPALPAEARDGPRSEASGGCAVAPRAGSAFGLGFLCFAAGLIAVRRAR